MLVASKQNQSWHIAMPSGVGIHSIRFNELWPSNKDSQQHHIKSEQAAHTGGVLHVEPTAASRSKRGIILFAQVRGNRRGPSPSGWSFSWLALMCKRLDTELGSWNVREVFDPTR